MRESGLRDYWEAYCGHQSGPVLIKYTHVAGTCICRRVFVYSCMIKLPAGLNVIFDLHSYVLFPAIGNIRVNKLINMQVTITWLWVWALKWVWFYVCSPRNPPFQNPVYGPVADVSLSCKVPNGEILNLADNSESYRCNFKILKRLWFLLQTKCVSFCFLF